MNLLFKKENFSPEFKRIVGIVDADLAWEKLKQPLEIATDEIVDVIGELNYLSIAGPDVPESLDKFFEHVKYLIAFKAYMLYAPTGDLVMTNKGRAMRRDEYEVSAFQWQLQNHDESLEAFFYRSMNLLLKYMVKNNLVISLEKYRHNNLVVPTLQDFEKHYGLKDSYFLYLNLLPGIKEFEELEMLSRIGEELYDDRQLLRSKVVLYNYCQKAAVYYAIEWGLRHLDFQMFPKSIVRNANSSSQSDKKSSGTFMPAELALVFENDCERYMKKIEREMSALRLPVDASELILPDLDFDENDNFIST